MGPRAMGPRAMGASGASGASRGVLRAPTRRLLVVRPLRSRRTRLAEHFPSAPAYPSCHPVSPAAAAAVMNAAAATAVMNAAAAAAVMNAAAAAAAMNAAGPVLAAPAGRALSLSKGVAHLLQCRKEAAHAGASEDASLKGLVIRLRIARRRLLRFPCRALLGPLRGALGRTLRLLYALLPSHRGTRSRRRLLLLLLLLLPLLLPLLLVRLAWRCGGVRLEIPKWDGSLAAVLGAALASAL